MHPPAVIDVEASGFGPGSYPIEVGFVLPDGDVYCTLIQPESHWAHWDPDAAKTHGIDRDLLLAHGRPATEVARDMNSRLAGMTVYCDGWYHDYTWISRLYDAADLAPTFRLEDLRTLLEQDEADRWHPTKDAVQEELRFPRHRASNDARLLQITLVRVKGAAH